MADKVFNVREHLDEVESFLQECIDLSKTKSSDYNPEGADAFSDVRDAATDIGVQPHHILFVHIRKHFAALRTYMRHGHLEAEQIHDRLRDIAVYCALMHTVLKEKGKC